MNKNLPSTTDQNAETGWILTPWGILMAVLWEYDIDASHITSTIGNHLVEDFMKYMELSGYVRHCDE